MEHAPFRIRGNSVRHGLVQGALRAALVEGIADRGRRGARSDGAVRTHHEGLRSPGEENGDGLPQAGDEAPRGRGEESSLAKAGGQEGARPAAGADARVEEEQKSSRGF